MILREIFFDVSMSYGHDGLSLILKGKTKNKQVELKDNECAIFVNKAWTALKLLTAKETVLHLRRPRNRPIYPETIPLIPTCIEGNKLNYDVALKIALEKEFSKRGFRMAKKGRL